MDLEDGVESTPGILSDHQSRLVPFLGAHQISEKQQINCCKQLPSGQTLQQRQNSALAVSIETDVWLLGEIFYLIYLKICFLVIT